MSDAGGWPISPPALTLLTIGSFATLYNAWVNYPRSKQEMPLLLSDIILDVVTIAVTSLGVEWFHRNGSKLFAWIISIIPIALIMLIALLVILIRLREETQMSQMRDSTLRVILSVEDRRLIRDKILSLPGKNLKSMSDQWKSYLRVDDRLMNTPTMRMSSREHIVKAKQDSLQPMVHLDQSVNPSVQFRAMGEEQGSWSKSQTAEYLPPGINLPQNVYSQDRVLMQHPNYQGASLDLAARAPQMRSQSSNKNFELHQKLQACSSQQHDKIMHVPELESLPVIEARHQGFAPLKNQAPRPRCAQGAAETCQLNLQQQPSTAGAEGQCMWRNVNGFQSVDGMYEPRFSQRDFRFEKRKERQAAYQQRRGERKCRIDGMISELVDAKKQYYYSGCDQGSCSIAQTYS